jgi:hypothetical protein
MAERGVEADDLKPRLAIHTRTLEAGAGQRIDGHHFACERRLHQLIRRERDAIADAQLVEQHVDRLGGHDAAEQ